MTRYRPEPFQDERDRPRSIRPVTALACFSVLVAIAYWPGNMDADALNQIEQARSGHFTDWWAPILDWCWRGLFLLHISPGFVLLGTILGVVFGIYEILRHFFHRWPSTLLTIAVCVYPPVFGYLGSLQHDTWFAAFALAAYALLFRAFRTTGASARRRLVLALLVLVWFGLAARINGILFLFPVIVAGVYLILGSPARHGRHGAQLNRRRSRTRLAISSGCALVIMIVFLGSQNLMTYHVIGAARSFPQAEVYEGDLAALSVVTNRVLLPRNVFPSQDLARLKRDYDPELGITYLLLEPDHPLAKADPHAVPPSLVGASGAATLRSAWVHAIIDYPGQYLRVRWRAWTYLIAWSDNSYEPYHPGIDQNPWSYQPLVPDLEHAALAYERWFNYPPLRGGQLYRTWVYLLICFLLAVDLSLPHREGRIRLMGLMAAAILVYYLAFFFIDPGLGFRFGWLMVIITLLSLVVDVHDRFRRIMSGRHRSRWGESSERSSDPISRDIIKS